MNLGRYKMEILGIGAVILAASFFYFYNITERGFFVTDEALFMLEADSYAQIPNIAVDFIFGARDHLQNTAEKYLPGFIIFSTTHRPIYIFLNTLGIWLFGRNDFSAFIVNGLVSLGAIVILYLIARMITGDSKKSLLIAFLFAVSGYQIYFARSGFSQLLTGFFMLFGSLFYLKTLFEKDGFYGIEVRKNLIWAGFLWGLMFMSHYSTVLILFFIFIFELLLYWFFYDRPVSFLLKRLVYLAVPFFGVLFLVQILTVLRNYILIKVGYPNSVNTYFDDLKSAYNEVIGYARDGEKNYLFYARMIKDLNGWPYLVLFLISPLTFLYKKWYQNAALSFIFFVTFLSIILMSLSSFTVTRTAVPINGLLSLIAALTLYEIFIFSRSNYRIIGVLVFLALTAFQLKIDWQIINLKSGYKEAAQFLKIADLPKEDIYSGSWPILSFYLNKKIQILNRQSSYVYLAADWHTDPLYLDLAEKGQLIATFENPAYDFIPARGDGFLGSAGGPEKIKIYKMRSSQ